MKETPTMYARQITSPTDYSRGSTDQMQRRYYAQAMHKQRQRKRRLRAALVALVAAIVVLAVAVFPSAFSFAAGLLHGGATGEASTPRSEWRQGTAPYLYQTDPEWSQVRYAGNSFGESGCGPTCMSMVYTMLTGKKDMDPAAMASFASRNGYASEAGTSWQLMTAGAEAIGLSSEPVSADAASIREHLMAGEPVICSVGPGDFTTEGHFIVLVGIDSQGNAEIRDPNSKARSMEDWPISKIVQQSVGLWAYTAVQ